MSENFIPLNQSTPVGGRWQGRNNSNNQGSHYQQNNRYQNGQSPRRGAYNNRWGNNSHRNSSYGSDNSSYGQDKGNIDAYLHPSMLQDPWAQLRMQLDQNK